MVLYDKAVSEVSDYSQRVAGWCSSLYIELVLVELWAGEGDQKEIEEEGTQHEHEAQHTALYRLTRHHLGREKRLEYTKFMTSLIDKTVAILEVGVLTKCQKISEKYQNWYSKATRHIFQLSVVLDEEVFTRISYGIFCWTLKVRWKLLKWSCVQAISFSDLHFSNPNSPQYITTSLSL